MELEKTILLTPEEEKDLFSRYKNGEKQLEERLILSNMGLVYFIMHKYKKNSPYEEEDLVQYGIEALIKAVRKFDVDKGVRFNSYAFMVIEKYLITLYNKRDKSLDTHVVTSLNELIGDSETELGSLLEDTDIILESNIFKEQDKETVAKLFEALTDRERLIISYKYGFTGTVYSYRQIKTILNISVERIRQIEFKALRKMRIMNEKNNIATR